MKADAFVACVITEARFADIESLHDYLLGTACRIVADGKSIAMPLTFVLTNEGQLAIIPAPPTKNALMRFQRSIVTEPLVRACAVVFEAWVSSAMDEMRRTKPDLMPADDPNRKEALVVSIMTAGRQALTISPIKRPSNAVQKAPFQWLDEVGGTHEDRFVR